MIAFERVSKTFEGPRGEVLTAVDELDLEIPTGETHCLLGTSGCGKTTTMKMVNRLIEPTAGTIRVDGEDILSLEPTRLRRRIGYVIQEGGLFPHMDVARNVGLMMQLEGWDVAKREARTLELLDLVNLPHDEFAHRFPHELSGGQRQRVGVARALALDPPHILMDEPFGALDPITRAQVQREFLDLNRRVQKTVLLVTHDVSEAFLLGDRITLMNEGRIVQTGTEAALRTSPRDDFVRSFLETV
ncbi:MAG: ATP-binding cassette domain-containing protein [Planctomycetes bacterium]|nr:ATP-binding cassette domain-containing protein [Planctomycetota bacterium]MCB9890911.1 ATP-binding cassette domain-containing protein [Planctomycetota bacterium]